MILTVKDGHFRIYFSNCSFVVPKQKYFNKFISKIIVILNCSLSQIIRSVKLFPLKKTIFFQKFSKKSYFKKPFVQEKSTPFGPTQK